MTQKKLWKILITQRKFITFSSLGLNSELHAIYSTVQKF